MSVQDYIANLNVPEELHEQISKEYTRSKFVWLRSPIHNAALITELIKLGKSELLIMYDPRADTTELSQIYPRPNSLELNVTFGGHKLFTDDYEQRVLTDDGCEIIINPNLLPKEVFKISYTDSTKGIFKVSSCGYGTYMYSGSKIRFRGYEIYMDVDDLVGIPDDLLLETRFFGFRQKRQQLKSLVAYCIDTIVDEIRKLELPDKNCITIADVRDERELMIYIANTGTTESGIPIVPGSIPGASIDLIYDDGKRQIHRIGERHILCDRQIYGINYLYGRYIDISELNPGQLLKLTDSGILGERMEFPLIYDKFDS